MTFAFVLALVFLLRHHKKKQNGNGNGNGNGDGSQLDTTSFGIPSFVPSPRTDPPSSYISNQRVQEWNGPPMVQEWNPPIAEMESESVGAVGSPTGIDRGCLLVRRQCRGGLSKILN